MTRNLVGSPEANVRNMAKEKLDFVLSGMEKLLKKVSGAVERQEWMEKMSLDLVQMCFKSQFLDRKI